MVTFKALSQDNIQPAKETLNEYIPLTSSLFSGSYGVWPTDTNLKTYTHGLFESVYDYPYLSSSANHIMDITFGVREGAFVPSTDGSKKYRLYKEMAQTLLGFDSTGSIKNFSLDGTNAIDSALFFNFSRLLTKDGIKIASLNSSIGTGSFATPHAGFQTFSDANAVNVYEDSPAGQYWYLYTGSAYASADRVGMVFYQAGVVLLSPAAAVFATSVEVSSAAAGAETYTVGYGVSASIDEIGNSWRRNLDYINFSNTVQINSTIFNCPIGLNEFNYSSNPTYLSGSQIRVKDGDGQATSITYITTIGLYSPTQDLLAIGKASEPLRKTSSDSMTIRVRLDY